MNEQENLSFQDWKVLKLLGKGGFKVVYEIEKQSKREALKISLLEDASIADIAEQELFTNEIIARTEREIQLIEKFGGNQIVSLGSVSGQRTNFEGKDVYLYSEEFLPGDVLNKLIQKNKQTPKTPDWKDILCLYKTGIEVLNRFSTDGIIYRDIKPQNIMATGIAYRPFVFFDFGIAFLTQGISLTQNTFGPGTLRYRAPETLDANYRGLLDVRSDLFSLAATVFEFATNKHPIHEGALGDGETVYRLMRQPAIPITQERDDLPLEFCNLIDMSLKKRPALRPNLASINKILEGL
ncbi:MAG: protein kinase [Fibromonadales bacterium]|nr:protein kinase [Fibromonadales bacterium]